MPVVESTEEERNRVWKQQKKQRDSWLSGDDVVDAWRRRRGFGDVRKRKNEWFLKRCHAFTENCDCVECVSMTKQMEAVGETSGYF